MPSEAQARVTINKLLEATRMEAVRGLIPAFEAKIQRVLARVWGTNEGLANLEKTSTI